MIRHRRQLMSPSSVSRFPRRGRVRRHEKNVGFFIPEESDHLSMLEWSTRLTKIFMRRVQNVQSPLNTFEEFYSSCGKAISLVMTRYPCFTSPSEYRKLVKTSVSHRCRDLIRSMFFKKRWGFSVSYQESTENEDVIATVASENHRGSVCLSESSLISSSPSPLEALSYEDLLFQVRDNLSPEALEVFERFVEDHKFSKTERIQFSSELEEIKRVLKMLGSRPLHSPAY